MSAENVAIIEGIYKPFAAGDVAGVLGAMSQRMDRFRVADERSYLRIFKG
jgi:TPP-dependent trihydroxycyclohexane-1,2-dione (THcHDO) dehydratase